MSISANSMKTGQYGEKHGLSKETNLTSALQVHRSVFASLETLKSWGQNPTSL